MLKNGNALIETVKDKCRVCYTCVRECPVKAIRLVNGQAEVIGERCICCGNCVKVCSQNAKRVYSSIESVERILASRGKTVALIAPSFPAEFADVNYQCLVGALRRIGFDFVVEVGFGADIVAKCSKEILDKKQQASFISSSCPALVSYIEKYYPHLINNIMPLVSPMIATARIVREKYQGNNPEKNNLELVFIGPCLAKKGEIERDDLKNEVNDVLTFKELKQLFKIKQIDLSEVVPTEFDPPLANYGSLFSLSRGAFLAAGINEDYIDGEVIAASGKENFVEAIKEFNAGYLESKLMEVLCCQGCIMGSGFSLQTPLYKKQYLVRQYVKAKLEKLNLPEWEEQITKWKNIDFSTQFNENNQRLPEPDNERIVAVLKQIGKNNRDDELNCGACGYETCREHAIAILKGLAESEMCLPYLIDKLEAAFKELEISYDELKNIKEELNHREKLASMGQLAAGIAHEINNPLGVILMYAHILLEQTDKENIVQDDAKMIVEQADRCKKIVSGLLNFARQNKLVKSKTNIIKLLQKCITTINFPETTKVEITNRLKDNYLEIDKTQITQVAVNLLTNALDSIGKDGLISIEVDGNESEVAFSVEDNGPGIPSDILKRIFEPFFTTKQIGKGTGLGLPVSYGIVKMHSGKIEVRSNTINEKGKTGTKVVVTLPRE